MKRNLACEKATGEFILHWDDDDIYAADWISRQVEILLSSNADISGLSHVMFYSMSSKQYYSYEFHENNSRWICGATLAFRKSLWEKYPFVNMQVGEDADFIINSGGRLSILDYEYGYQAKIHLNNLSIKHTKS